jgi:hypothetical protein
MVFSRIPSRRRVFLCSAHRHNSPGRKRARALLEELKKQYQALPQASRQVVREHLRSCAQEVGTVVAQAGETSTVTAFSKYQHVDGNKSPIRSETGIAEKNPRVADACAEYPKPQ